MAIDPMTLASLVPSMLGGGGTKVSQTASNTASAIISANISGISTSPTTGAPYNPQTNNATSSAMGSDTPSNPLSGLFGGFASSSGSFATGYDGMTGADIAAPSVTGFFEKQSAMLGVAALVLGGLGAWYVFGGEKVMVFPLVPIVVVALAGALFYKEATGQIPSVLNGQKAPQTGAAYPSGVFTTQSPTRTVIQNPKAGWFSNLWQPVRSFFTVDFSPFKIFGVAALLLAAAVLLKQTRGLLR